MYLWPVMKDTAVSFTEHWTPSVRFCEGVNALTVQMSELGTRYLDLANEKSYVSFFYQCSVNMCIIYGHM